MRKMVSYTPISRNVAPDRARPSTYPVVPPLVPLGSNDGRPSPRSAGSVLTSTLIYSQTAFIKQEALEKAREIKVKADEEFAIEKVTTHFLRRDHLGRAGPSRPSHASYRSISALPPMTDPTCSARSGQDRPPGDDQH